MLVALADVAAVFVFVGMRESTLLGFTGMGRVLVGLSHAMLMVLPLLDVSTKIRSKMRKASSKRKITATISGCLMSGSVTFQNRRSGCTPSTRAAS